MGPTIIGSGRRDGLSTSSDGSSMLASNTSPFTSTRPRPSGLASSSGPPNARSRRRSIDTNGSGELVRATIPRSHRRSPNTAKRRSIGPTRKRHITELAGCPPGAHARPHAKALAERLEQRKVVGVPKPLLDIVVVVRLSGGHHLLRRERRRLPGLPEQGIERPLHDHRERGCRHAAGRAADRLDRHPRTLPRRPRLTCAEDGRACWLEHGARRRPARRTVLDEDANRPGRAPTTDGAVRVTGLV